MVMDLICAIDEWLVRNIWRLHRTMLEYDYWQFLFDSPELQRLIELKIYFHD